MKLQWVHCFDVWWTPIHLYLLFYCNYGTTPHFLSLSLCRLRRVVENSWAEGCSDDEHGPRNRHGGLYLCGVPHHLVAELLLLPEQPWPQAAPPLSSDQRAYGGCMAGFKSRSGPWFIGVFGDFLGLLLNELRYTFGVTSCKHQACIRNEGVTFFRVIVRCAQSSSSYNVFL